MRTRHRVARQIIDEQRITGAAAPTIASNPRDPLRLPAFNAPAVLTQGRAQVGQRLAPLALALMGQRLIPRRSDKSVQQLVTDGLQRLMDCTLGELKVVERFSINIGPTVNAALGYLNHNDEEAEGIWIGLDSDSSGNLCFIGEAVMQLESEVPGLGQAIMFALEMSSLRTFSAWTPSHAYDIGSYVVWFGATTHEEWLEEVIAMEDDPDGWDLSPKTYEDHFPAQWVFKPSKPKGLTKILQTAGSHPGKRVREVAVTLKAIFRQLKKNPWLEPIERMGLDEEPVYRSALVRWDEEDAVERIADEFTYHANQCGDGYTTLFAMYHIESDCAAATDWLRRFKQGLALYKLLDSLLSTVSCGTEQE